MNFDKILKEVDSLSSKERQIALHCVDEEEAIYAIKNAREYEETYNYQMAGMRRDAYKNKFTPHNEKSKATPNILYEEMDD